MINKILKYVDLPPKANIYSLGCHDTLFYGALQSIEWSFNPLI
jgi:hypothetical protein